MPRRKKKVTETEVAAKEKKPKKRRVKKKGPKTIVAAARRKCSVARATVKEGKNIIRINKVKIELLPNKQIREVIEEPLRIAEEYVKNLNIDVNVRGGGMMGQAQAARTAIARGIVEFTKDEALRHDYLERDRYLLVEDPRFVEPKKYKGRKARARFQKSYR